MESDRPNLEKLRNLLVEQCESIKELRRSIADFSSEMKRLRAAYGWVEVEDELPEYGKSVLVCGYWKTEIDGKIFKSSIVSGLGAIIGNDKGFTRECILRSIVIKRGYSVDSYVILK